MEQTKALNALEPFLALSKSRYLAAGCVRSGHPGYQCTEYLCVRRAAADAQTSRNLRSSEEYAAHLTLLEIFAWGTWEDYKCMSLLISPAALLDMHGAIR